MTTLQTLILMLTFGLFSCNEKSENSSTKNQNVLIDTEVSLTDTIEKIVVDDYPVKNNMLAHKTIQNTSYKLQSGKTISHDKVWFGNDSLKQTLVFELYTNYHRLTTFHFLDSDIPKDLIKRMELHKDDGELSSDKQKLNDFDGLLKHTTNINSTYFITDKGFKLGDTKQKAIKTYGKPDKQTLTDGIEKLEWYFVGDNSYEGNTDLKGKPLADNSFGHQISMYFRHEKLIAQILHNDIP